MATTANMLAEVLGDVFDAQTAAGSSQSDAATMRAAHVQVASLTEGQGIVLRAGNANDMRSVANTSSASLYVYPPVGASFNGMTANAPIDLPAKSAALFIFVTGTKINAIV